MKQMEFGSDIRHWITLLLIAAAGTVTMTLEWSGADDHEPKAGAASALSSASAKISAEEIIAKVDGIRNPAESYRMKAEVSSSDSTGTSVFDVLIRGNNKTLVRTLEPFRDRGRNLLMLNEEMWAYIPNIKRSVRVSLSQKLSGQAANGDISRMRWSGDYTPVIESSGKGEWVLLLTARKKGLTYEKVRVWVDQSSYRPKKSEFLTAAGKVLKTATYQDYRDMAGKVRPTQIVIQDALRSSDRSVLKIVSMEVREFPESTFNQNSMN